MKKLNIAFNLDEKKAVIEARDEFNQTSKQLIFHGINALSQMKEDALSNLRILGAFDAFIAMGTKANGKGGCKTAPKYLMLFPRRETLVSSSKIMPVKVKEMKFMYNNTSVRVTYSVKINGYWEVYKASIRKSCVDKSILWIQERITDETIT